MNPLQQRLQASLQLRRRALLTAFAARFPTEAPPEPEDDSPQALVLANQQIVARLQGRAPIAIRRGDPILAPLEEMPPPKPARPMARGHR